MFTFTDANPDATTADYTALVTLGNGKTVTLTSTASKFGKIVVDPSTAGLFEVKLSYTYAEELTDSTFTVKVTDDGGATTQASDVIFSVVTTRSAVSAPLCTCSVKV